MDRQAGLVIDREVCLAPAIAQSLRRAHDPIGLDRIMTTIRRGRRTSLIMRGVLIVAAMLARVAAAETPEQHQACMDDAFQFCSDAMPDRERVFACLAEKRNVISPLCREGMAAFLPPEPPPAAQRASKVPSRTKAKPRTKTKPGTKKARAPLSLTPSGR
jgi:hypothetical protein